MIIYFCLSQLNSIIISIASHGHSLLSLSYTLWWKHIEMIHMNAFLCMLKWQLCILRTDNCLVKSGQFMSSVKYFWAAFSHSATVFVQNKCRRASCSKLPHFYFLSWKDLSHILSTREFLDLNFVFMGPHAWAWTNINNICARENKEASRISWRLTGSGIHSSSQVLSADSHS